MEVNEPECVYVLNAASHAIVSVYANYKVKHLTLRILLAIDAAIKETGEADIYSICRYAGLHKDTVFKYLWEYNRDGIICRSGNRPGYKYHLPNGTAIIVQHYYNTIEAIRGDKNKPKKPETNGHRVAKKKRDTTL